MIVKTRIFELCGQEYRNLSEMAQAMGISVSQIYRVQQGKRHINQKFIVGAIKAFPNHKLDDLFYLAPELPVSNDSALRSSVTRPVAKSAAGDKGIEAEMQHSPKMSTLATG